MNDTLFQKHTRWQHSGSGGEDSRPHTPRSLLAIAVGAVALTIVASLIIRMFVGMTSSAAAAPPPTSSYPVAALPTATVQPTLPVPTPTPSCTSGATFLKTIGLFEARSQWEQAADTAEIALHDPSLCPADAQALAGKSVSDGLEAVFTQPLPSYTDLAAQQHQVDRYHSLKQQAATADLPFPTRLQIATRAYGVGQFLLSKTAFEEAWSAGEFTAADQSLIQQFYASLYNLGLHWVEEGSGKTRQDGVALLVAADMVDSTYHLGARTAWGALHQLLGDEHTWPAPAATPLLQNV